MKRRTITYCLLILTRACLIKPVALLGGLAVGLFGSYPTVAQPAPVRALSLSEVLQEARRNSPVLLAEGLNVRIAQADVVTAGLRPNPVLNNQSLQLLRSGNFPEGTRALNSLNRQVWWQVTSPVNVAHQRQKAVKVAEQTVELTRRNVAETERNLLLNVAQAWLDAWSARRGLDLINRAQQNLDTLVRISQVRLRNQVITQTDLLRTEVLADQYRLKGRTARQTYSNQLAELRRLLGTADSIDVVLTDAVSPLEGRVSATRFDTLAAQTLRNRPDVRVAEQAATVAGQNVELQQALRHPRPEVGLIYNPQNSIPYLGFYGTLPLPLFSRNQGEIQKAKVVAQQTGQVTAYTRQQAQTEVQTAYRSYQTQRGNVERYAGILERATQVLASVRYAYLRGGTSIVDFLDAQRSLLDVQEEYLNSEVAYRQALIQLLFVAGQLQ